MIRTIVSIIVTFALIAGLAVYEMYYVHTTFGEIYQVLQTLQTKSLAQTANAEDGESVQQFWESKKRTLHIWIPHTSLQEMDLQMSEALGFIKQEKYDDALPKIEVLLDIAQHLPSNYTFGLENIF